MSTEIHLSSSSSSSSLGFVIPNLRTWRGLNVDGFRLLPGVRNVPPDLLEAMVTPPAEPNPRTSTKWRSRPPKALKYVDDGLRFLGERERERERT